MTIDDAGACCPRSRDVPVEPPHYTRFDISHVGGDDDFVYQLMQCKTCRTTFGHLLMENDGFSGSGRWYMFEVPAECAADKAGLKALCWQAMAEREWMYIGGSYWGHA